MTLFIYNIYFTVSSLPQSDDSSDGGKMEVGDVSDDHEGDKSIW